VAPRATRGLVHQFGLLLPHEGEDALLHCGLGLHLRNPGHAPNNLPAQHMFDTRLETRIAGLDVILTHAPSDATDSITVRFPALALCVNNLIWLSLFNVFAVRGEEYRDPQIVVRGIDEIHAYEPESLIGTHGPPLSGDGVAEAIVDSRDAIQFLWDQTVRGVNRGLRLDELTRAVQLPDHFRRSYFTRQLYGLVEHHVRQIHAGLFGWLDEDESHLFPVPESERAEKLIQGFGGRDQVADQAVAAIAEGDWRWAAELATWLVRSSACSPADRNRLAMVMRHFAQHTPRPMSATGVSPGRWCWKAASTCPAFCATASAGTRCSPRRRGGSFPCCASFWTRRVPPVGTTNSPGVSPTASEPACGFAIRWQCRQTGTGPSCACICVTRPGPRS